MPPEPDTATPSASATTARRRLGGFVLDTRPLKIVPFRRLWVSTAITAIGSQLTAVAVPKQVYDITNSSGWVGIAGAVALVPLLVFGLWGGAIADTVDRRKLLLWSNSGIALTSLLLWVQAALHLNSVLIVLVLLAVQQGLFAINQPARSASVARLVPPALLPAANAVYTTVFNFGAVLGPLLAGAFIPVVGLPTLYLIDTVGLCVTMWAVWRLPALPPLAGPSRRAGLRDVLDGMRYLSVRPVLLASFVVDIIAMVAGMPRALFPEMAERTFGDPPGGGVALGWLFAAIPIGAVICGLLSGWLSRISRQGVAVVIAVCAWGVAIAGFGLSHSLLVAALFLGLAGAADMVSSVFRNSILQTAATDEMRGRMQGVFTIVVTGGPRIADTVHGVLGAAVGTTVTVAGGGIMVIVLVIIAAALLPAFRAYRAPRAGEPAVVDTPAKAPDQADLVSE